MHTYHHFIWDFDGMLFDTYPHTVAAFCECCRRFGIPADEKEAYALFKVTMRHAFARYGFTPAHVEAFYQIENDLDFLPRGVPYPHIPALLRQIAEHGGHNYLYTHRDKVALQYLDLYGLTGLFTDFVTGEDGFPLKPAPDALNALIKRNGLKKDACLMLGDRDIDIGAGVTAGIGTLLYDDENRYPEGVGETWRCTDAQTLEQTIMRFLK